MNLKNVSIAVVFIWIGFVCAISFMEAWLKFQAPGITIPLGLGIGRLVFKALNIMEITFALCIISQLWFAKAKETALNFYFILTLLILTIQTFYMLPKLDERAMMYLSGNIPASSNLHITYIVSEFVKVLSLLMFGFKLLNNTNNENNIRTR